MFQVDIPVHQTQSGHVPSYLADSDRGVVPLRHLRHVPPPPSNSIATLVNSLQNRVNCYDHDSITLCITMNAKTWKIVCVISDLR